MERIKGKGIFITALAVVLTIGTFSALFIGANTIAFATANNREVSLPETTTPVSTQAIENAIPEGYKSPSITVVENHDRNIGTKSPNALTAEEAAELGAQYIWEVMGESIDGATVELYYLSFPSSTRPYWYGNVIVGTRMEMLQNPVIGEDGQYVLDKDGYILMQDYQEFEVEEYSFYFILDGVTGERVSIHRCILPEIRMMDPNRLPTPKTQQEVDAENAQFRAMSGQYQQLVEEYAQKHFNNTKVVSVEYELGFSRFDGISQLLFIAIDETGREANITFDINNKQMIGLCTQGNDIVPGYDFGWTMGEIPF